MKQQRRKNGGGRWLTGMIMTVVLVLTLTHGYAVAAVTTPPVDPEHLQAAYSEEEVMTFEVGWGPFKAGTLVMHILPDPDRPEHLTVTVIARTSGALNLAYPVEDRFVNEINGDERLPSRMEMTQHERKRRNHKLTQYDQINNIVTYSRNNGKERVYHLDGPVHNEFSSFLILRALLPAGEIVVPTFADAKRHLVEVETLGKEKIDSLFGPIQAIKVQPHLHFKGLYEKMGDPVIWFSDNRYRVPLKIRAKIAIGSLTAYLVEYRRKSEIFAPPR